MNLPYHGLPLITSVCSHLLVSVADPSQLVSPPKSACWVVSGTLLFPNNPPLRASASSPWIRHPGVGKGNSFAGLIKVSTLAPPRQLLSSEHGINIGVSVRVQRAYGFPSWGPSKTCSMSPYLKMAQTLDVDAICSVYGSRILQYKWAFTFMSLSLQSLLCCLAVRFGV